MSIGLALGGGLLSGAGQGLMDDVAQMVKERADDLAFQRTQTLQGQQQDFQGTQNDLSRQQQTAIQNSQQGFQGGENALNRQQQTDLENQRLDAQASEGAAGRANSMAIANIDDGTPNLSDVLANGTRLQYGPDGKATLQVGPDGKPALYPMDATTGKLDAARAEAAKVAGANLHGFSPEDAQKVEGYLRNGYTPESPPTPTGQNPGQPAPTPRVLGAPAGMPVANSPADAMKLPPGTQFWDAQNKLIRNVPAAPAQAGQ